MSSKTCGMCDAWIRGKCILGLNPKSCGKRRMVSIGVRFASVVTQGGGGPSSGHGRRLIAVRTHSRREV